MVKFKIQEPIWKNRSVGLASHLIKANEDVHVEILYRDKQGNRTFPGLYIMSGRQALDYPVQTVRYGTKVHLIPISDFRHRGGLA
jgi:hypothetical protein